MQPEREVQSITELVQRWRSDALVFLRHDAPKLLVIVVVAAILIALMRVLRRRLRHFSDAKVLPGLRAQQLRTLSDVIFSAGVFVIIFVAALQALPLLGVNIGPLLASAGIAGLAIGFGAQTLVRDIINGFFILMENQYEVGDVVRVAGITGTVEGMTLRKTVVRDDQGALTTIPNSEIKIVSNLTRDWAQVALRVSVAYTENSDRIIRLLQEVGSELRNDPQFSDLLVGDPQVPGIERVTGNEVEYLMLVKTRPNARYAVSRELRRRIKECFQKNNVQPGPGRMYVIDSASTPTAGSS